MAQHRATLPQIIMSSSHSTAASRIVAEWTQTATPAPVEVVPNNFIHKSLSSFSCNFAVGCAHGCSFCSVPQTSVNKLSPQLEKAGVSDPDLDWGKYVFVRKWDERAFLSSLAAAERTPVDQLKPDGHRAVMMCSTTDPYQTLPDKALNAKLRVMVRRSLELIRDHSTLNVRILTRSPLVREDFDVISSLGNRVMLGMSIPTLDAKLTRIYEPGAPAPAHRLKVLHEATRIGIPTYVAMAPVFPESSHADLAATLQGVADAEVMTIFCEPINLRAQNITRIEMRAEELGVKLNTAVFATAESWQAYALDTLHAVEHLAAGVGVGDRLHLWPDKLLGTAAAARRLPTEQREAHQAWVEKCWARISEWPE